MNKQCCQREPRIKTQRKSFANFSSHISHYPIGITLLGSKVKVETFIGTVEGTLKNIDYEPSHRAGILYPKWLVLENENGFTIIRHWQVVKVSFPKLKNIRHHANR